MAKKAKKQQKERLFEEKLVPSKKGSGELFDVSYGDDDGKPVECLGMTFENDTARREYFTEKLREKLQDAEFRKIEGFPVGEVDDILAMSDPPYYTACPNPFLDDFIAHCGTTYDSSTEYHREPFTADVSEGKTDALYTAHAYHTKVPHKAIMRYLLHYTMPGDIVLDGFCGTGMTGVAAQMCGDKQEIESLGYSVSANGEVCDNSDSEDVVSRLGPRRAILGDLSPAATFIAANLGRWVDAKAFRAEADRILNEIEDELGWMYETLHSDGKSKGRIEYTVWSDVFACGECGEEIVFVKEALDRDKGSIRKTFPCPGCGAESNKNGLELIYESKLDKALGTPLSHPKRVPVFIVYSHKGTRYEKEPDDADHKVLRKIDELPFPSGLPTLELPDMQMRRVGRMQPSKITHIHHFFLPRSATWLAAAWNKAEHVTDARMRATLLFFVEQAIWTASLLNRFRPTGYSQVNQYLTGVFYAPSQHAECSPWYILSGKAKRLTKLFEEFRPQSNSRMVTTQDLAHIRIPDNSVDYVFTDPPFGENIYYSDLNILIESWHGVQTAPEQEAIVDRVKEKSLLDYQRMMSDCFVNYYRMLKPGRWMTVEFHNSQNRVWNAIQEGLQHAGFVVADVRTLDKKQGSFQQVVSGNTVKRDLIISAYKPNGGLEERFEGTAGTEQGVWDFVSSHLRQLPVFVMKGKKAEPVAERQNHLLFDRMVAFHVQRGVSVPLSSAEFHSGLIQRYPERDGMCFLPEQVAEYDKRRMQAEEVVQLELFVSDEASAVNWVRQQLGRKPQSFGELQPQFMQEEAGWEKYEKRLELSELLEQNFLCYDGKGEVPSQIHSYLSTNFHDLRGLEKDAPKLISKAKHRWYVPDHRKEADLEKIRHRALMKEFEEYQDAKGKLKIVRTEALRAGFKQCWQDGDYQGIVDMAKKVKDDIIQEDPALLMYYDNASMRTGD
ncbi:DNA methyltransferase [Rubinisphaera brasiliensis]|uniref:DNA methylase N-4/N-6 domain protein n=1 Tax=Rubinisphaera brasiliensis (strain ATCC 49424 / DSM 5305 / JCM 21570 / IAM 15109 / NBRC 103401 / IFAM 1448) TaxID=756272 RepID=F0SKT6_RUBBR|nr:DNA methyltransferase [Rubinisphaera brasiliensis]ADY58756.1 DNA methylase N-4/N-6 domain protein [Rubinisphaera brasiliensis DSM 5305]